MNDNIPRGMYAYLDQDHNVIPCDAEMYRRMTSLIERRRVVAQTHYGPWWISTVFLSINHGWGGPPLWFETMVFCGKDSDLICERYGTYAAALAGHHAVLERVLAGECWERPRWVPRSVPRQLCMRVLAALCGWRTRQGERHD